MSVKLGRITLDDLVVHKVRGIRSVNEDGKQYFEARVEVKVEGKIVSDRWYKVGESTTTTIYLDVS